MLKLNKYEQEQYSQLILKIRADLPFKKQQASVYIPLVRGRVCVAPFSYIPPRAARLFFYSHSKEVTQNVRKFRLENRP